MSCNNELRTNGWADHKWIKAAGIMEYNPTVVDLLEMPAFARKKELARRAREKREREEADQKAAQQAAPRWSIFA